ncbi:MAG: C4-dicarboxylate ABC transporter, partial [Polaromonas sp.]|nr:C4-dicarboxylate ABC transporter [Polaromonas sp.]
NDYTDHVTKKRIPAVTTAQIYKGSIAFIVLQLIMVAVIVFNPGIVTGNMDKAVKMDDATVMDMFNNMQDQQNEENAPPSLEAPGQEQPAGDAAPVGEEVDPMKALEEAMKKAE